MEVIMYRAKSVIHLIRGRYTHLILTFFFINQLLQAVESCTMFCLQNTTYNSTIINFGFHNKAVRMMITLDPMSSFNTFALPMSQLVVMFHWKNLTVFEVLSQHTNAISIAVIFIFG